MKNGWPGVTRALVGEGTGVSKIRGRVGLSARTAGRSSSFPAPTMHPTSFLFRGGIEV